ncbi:hypothetical protein BDP81DRAFT_395476 [Colletotrichum phormii]|uniref:Cyanovirin-N domain-containing protein n=1 Tax=Colletotrichum phormii TaxID=359342 RepID=A0AAI9ZQ59_9PEZI|nr:uncharacterized protein BDP81DRAFT_395476 [Colletotrichum phormii]KAK1634998.1 hypothetical protein BDP81DRAFT_395476 [Colletotrichum phormii]
MKFVIVVASLVIMIAAAPGWKSPCHQGFPCAHSVAGNCTQFDLNNEWRATVDSRQLNESWIYAVCPDSVQPNITVLSKLDLRNCIANDQGTLTLREKGGHNGQACTVSKPPPVPVGQEPVGEMKLQCWMPGNPFLKNIGLLAFKEVNISSMIWVDHNSVLGCYSQTGVRIPK